MECGVIVLKDKETERETIAGIRRKDKRREWKLKRNRNDWQKIENFK